MVPQRAQLSDAELLRRYRRLYPTPTKFPGRPARPHRSRTPLGRAGAMPGASASSPHGRRLAVHEAGQTALLQSGSTKATAATARSGPVSNPSWSSPPDAPSKPSRVHRPQPGPPLTSSTTEDYRFCGYGEAVAGNPDAQRGLLSLRGETDWSAAQAARLALFGTDAASISPEALQQVVATGVEASADHVAALPRIRHFTDKGRARQPGLRATTARRLPHAPPPTCPHRGPPHALLRTGVASPPSEDCADPPSAEASAQLDRALEVKTLPGARTAAVAHRLSSKR